MLSSRTAKVSPSTSTVSSRRPGTAEGAKPGTASNEGRSAGSSSATTATIGAVMTSGRNLHSGGSATDRHQWRINPWLRPEAPGDLWTHLALLRLFSARGNRNRMTEHQGAD